MERVPRILGRHGIGRENTLAANVICRDEINRRNVDALTEVWGHNFELAGLGGFPSGGVTAFSAYKSHVPDGGSLLIIFGPHVGVSTAGMLGELERPGMAGPSTSCGSVLGFLNKVETDPNYAPVYDALDPEQHLVEAALSARKEEFLGRRRPIKAVNEAMYRTIEEVVLSILDRIHFEGQVVLIGGLIVNTPHVASDFFIPRRADILNAIEDDGATHSWLEEFMG